MIRHRYAAVLLTVLLCAPLGRAAEIDPYLPEDTEIVLNVNIRQILDSPLIKKNLLEKAQESLRGNNEVQDVLKDLGFDPFTDLERVVQIVQRCGPTSDHPVSVSCLESHYLKCSIAHVR